ncbi:MAG: transglycosylase SLT domain-containing protein [Deltaproteobacteria bacterium]|nr:transglycosylase SLT domain-containing protein [Deltaproteobacteria bacterium]
MCVLATARARADEAFCPREVAADHLDWSVDPWPAVERSSLIDPRSRETGSESVAREDLRLYRRAKWLSRTGDQRRALDALEEAPRDLFADRVAILRGQVLEARRDFRGARAAYVEGLWRAESKGAAISATRGLVSVTGKLGELTAQVTYLDALAEALGPELEPQLILTKAGVQARLGRDEDARSTALSILDRATAPDVVSEVERFLSSLARRRRLSLEDRVTIGIARASAFARRSRVVAAMRTLKALRSLARGAAARPQALRIDLAIADLHRDRDARSLAEEVLGPWLQQPDLGERRADVLLRIGLLAADRYQYPKALAAFDECAAIGGPISEECVMSAARVEYDDRRYAEAAERTLAFVRRNPQSALAAEALWLGGWSASLARQNTRAIDAFDALLRRPDADQVERIQYWRARAYEREGWYSEASREYARVADESPLGFYGLMARARQLSFSPAEPIATLTPPPGPDTVDAILEVLGPHRPITIDRGVMLFEAGLQLEGAEELLAALAHYQRIGWPEGGAAVVDLFRLFGRDAWVFLLSRTVVEQVGRRPHEHPALWRVWRDAYPSPFEDEVDQACADNPVDRSLVYAVMRTESRFRADAVSPVGARGLMQLMPATARAIAKKAPRARLHARRYRAPESNIWLGARYLAELVEHFDGHVALAVGAYNAGPGAVDRWVRLHGDLEIDELIERVPYYETRKYLRRTLESYFVYRALYEAREIDALAIGGWSVTDKRASLNASELRRSR